MLIIYLSSVLLQPLKHKAQSQAFLPTHPSCISLDEAKSGLGPNLTSLLRRYIWKISNTKTLQQSLCKRQTVWTVHSSTGCISGCYSPVET